MEKTPNDNDRKHVTKNIPSFTAPYCLALEKSVGALVYRRKNDRVEYLVMQYPHGHWEFPRGHAEGSETEYETMYREVWEETGVEKESLTIHDGFRSEMSFWYVAQGDERIDRKKQKRCLAIHKKVVFFLAQTIEHTISLSHEHETFVWLDYMEAMDKLTYDNARRIITEAHDFLK